MFDSDAGVMSEIDIDAAFGRSSSITVNSRGAGRGATSADDCAGLVSRLALRYRGGV
jgi:hypothetical protein